MNKNKHEYKFGIIGNCTFMSYIDMEANIVWQCWPQFDSSFVFGSILDKEKGGYFYISPATENYSVKQSYIENTNVLETYFKCSDGEFKVIDFIPRFNNFERSYKPVCNYRKAEIISGTPMIRVGCKPVVNYGESFALPSLGSNSINYDGLSSKVRLTTNASLTHVLNEQNFTLSENKYFVLTYGPPLEAPLERTFNDFFERTKEYWRDWVRASSIPNIYQKEVIRSALLLKLHQFEDTGAFIASGMTSLPEHPGSGRNWDYRYCWIRDSYFTLTALIGLGHFSEAEKYSHWIQDIVQSDSERIQPVYKIDGVPEIHERILEDIKGYQDNAPVRVGNDAYRQKQNDAYGQMILSLEPLYTDLRVYKGGARPSIDLIDSLLNQINSVMNEPDAGIWEFRGIAQKHAESYLFHWAGAQAAKKIGVKYQDEELTQKAEDIIQKSIDNIELCFDNDEQLYGMSQENKDVNASEFLLVTMGYLNDLKKSKKHIDGLEKKLKTKNDLIYRYITKDDFGETNSTFLICAFWYAESLIEVGEIDKAKNVFDNLIQKSNHLGIFSEDICPLDESQWGNFAQTYSHVGLIITALKLAKKIDRPSFLMF